MPALEALGATTMFMGDADTIDALQQGVIDGAISSVATYDSWNYYEVTPIRLSFFCLCARALFLPMWTVLKPCQNTYKQFSMKL